MCVGFTVGASTTKFVGRADASMEKPPKRLIMASRFRERPVIRYGLKVELFRCVSQFDPTVMS
jgi:hypothetical protein